MKIPLPDNTIMFPADAPTTHRLDALGVAIHGQSYPRRDVTDDLTTAYPSAIDGMINIGVLHTSLGRTFDAHPNYAPCSVAGLRRLGYHYWALGHVHTREIIDHDPLIVFPGNIQGRHLRETGPKGCVIVEGDLTHLNEPTFHPLDSVRWLDETVSVEGITEPNESVELAVEAIQKMVAENAGVLPCVRITIAGRTAAHRRLIDERAQIEATIRGYVTPEAWLAELRVATRPPIDLDALRARKDVYGDLYRKVAAVRSDPAPDRATW